MKAQFIERERERESRYSHFPAFLLILVFGLGGIVAAGSFVSTLSGCQQEVPVGTSPANGSNEFGTVQAAIITDESSCSPSYYTSTEWGPANLTTTGDQEYPSVAGIAGEKAIVVWQAEDQVIGYDGETPITDPDLGIFAAIVDRDGDAFHSNGFDYHINTDHGMVDEDSLDQQKVNVTAKTSGNNSRILFVWQSTDRWGESTGEDVVASMWTYSDGNGSLTRNTNYNPTTTTGGNEQNPAAAPLWNEDKMVVVWDNGDNIYLSICNHTGTCSPQEQQVNNSDDDVDYVDCELPRVDSFRSENGGFVVVFLCDPDSVSGDFKFVYYKRYDDDGTELDTSPVKVDTGTSYFHINLFGDVACLDNEGDDRFAVTWRALTGSAATIRYKVYEHDGTVEQPTSEAHTHTHDAYRSRITAYAGGTKFAITSDNEDGSNWNIYMRRFDVNGDPIDGSTIADVGTTTGQQRYPAIGVMKCDSFGIVWQSDHPSTFDIFGRFYDE